MTKVITYGTYDFLHEGHVRLLERAKALGDYLIVGVTADGFDMARGKINVGQSLMERIEAVRRTGLADKIIIEEYEGQKIDDIRKYGVDIFTVGSDWVGKFDYLNDYCKVVYLERTKGISSTEIRSHNRELRIGIVGESNLVNKFQTECKFVNGITVSCVYAESDEILNDSLRLLSNEIKTFEDVLSRCDAVYIASIPSRHYLHVKKALEAGVHVLCESPVALTAEQFGELCEIAKARKLVLMDGIKTAYSLAFNRMMLLIKGGIIGQVVSVDTTCTSLLDIKDGHSPSPFVWNALTWWGPTAMLPIFNIFGPELKQYLLFTKTLPENPSFDLFSKGSLVFDDGVASFKVGWGVKSEGEMIISGTKGYVYVPAPWWKTDYFEVRFENPAYNKRYFYQLEGEGIRHEILSFMHMIRGEESYNQISASTSVAIIKMMDQFSNLADK